MQLKFILKLLEPLTKMELKININDTCWWKMKIILLFYTYSDIFNDAVKSRNFAYCAKMYSRYFSLSDDEYIKK